MPLCSTYVLHTNWTIPNDTLSLLKPPMDAVRIVIFDATAAKIEYRSSPGFYLKNNTKATFPPQENITERTNQICNNGVGPPSGGEIGKQGAIGISAGLTVILIALLSQWFFLGHWRRRDGRTEQADCQDKTESDKCVNDYAERAGLL
jgi:hypothetical protein